MRIRPLPPIPHFSLINLDEAEDDPLNHLQQTLDLSKRAAGRRKEFEQQAVETGLFSSQRLL